MAPRTELAISYDGDLFPISAACTYCGEQMPKLAKDAKTAAEIILWCSVRFPEHKNLKHPTSRKSDDEEMFATDHDECRID
jgi:hypothetical protein